MLASVLHTQLALLQCFIDFFGSFYGLGIVLFNILKKQTIDFVKYLIISE